MRPYARWLQRHLTICNNLTVLCLIASVVCLIVAARSLYAGIQSGVWVGSVGCVGLALLSERFSRDADQLWRALRAWEPGDNELRHLPRRLLREVE